MKNMTGGQAVVAALGAQGTDHVFGLIGSAGMEIFDALYDARDIRFIGVRDERTGVHMADGYARASGQAGVFLAGQNGPGATNLVTGLAQAHAAYSPVVALGGSLSSAHIYRDAFQEVDQQALFKPITKKTYTLTQTARIPEMVGEAFRTALSPRRGPVMLNLPRDLLADSLDASAYGAFERAQVFDAVTAPRALLEQAAHMLAQAERPLIVAGGGVKNGRSQRAVLELAERLNAPIAMSPGHGDAIPCQHPLYAGQVGPRGNPVASNLAKQADVILALGTRLGFNTTFYQRDSLNPAAKLIQVEIEPTALGRFFPVDAGILGDADTVARDLVEALQDLPSNPLARAWVDSFAEQRRALRAAAPIHCSRPTCSRSCGTWRPTTPSTPWTRARCACRPPTRCGTRKHPPCSRRWTSAWSASHMPADWAPSWRNLNAPSSASWATAASAWPAAKSAPRSPMASIPYAWS
jgi:acetolactate synthase-1/2/3 large subunit/sulfoacetaldehyde acetyltransferase